MKKFLILSLMIGVLVFASPVLAKEGKSSFWAAASKLVQEIFQPEEMPVFEEEHEEELADEDFIDPKEVKQILKEIKDQKRELSRLAKQARKLTGAENILGEISTLLEQVSGFENSINEGVDLRDTIQEYRDAQTWEELNGIRAKVEIPKEMAQWNKDIKRLEKILTQKKYQNLGLDLTAARSKIDEAKAVLSRVQEFYNSGDFESAMEEFNGLREDFHPGEIMNVIQKMQELTNRLKGVKNAEIKEKVREAFSEVISNFNEGEFRTARELMDESWNDIMQMINQALSVGKRKGASRQNILQMTDKIQNQMKNKSVPAPQQPPQRSIERDRPMEQKPQIQPRPESESIETIRPIEPTPRPVEPTTVPAPRPIEPAPVIEAQPAPEPTR